MAGMWRKLDHGLLQHAVQRAFDPLNLLKSARPSQVAADAPGFS